LQKSGTSVPLSLRTREAGPLRASTAAASSWTRLAAIFLLIPALAMVAACVGGRGGSIPYDVKDFQAPDAPTVISLDQDYKIAPLDLLTISVFQVPDLSGDYKVDLTGFISIPLLGNIRAVDMTAAQLDQALTQQLGAKYLRSPDVSVAIKESSTRVVTVDGSVKQPGNYQIAGQTTLIQAIAMAHRVAVFRKIQGQRMAAAFDLSDIRRGKSEDPTLYAGDIVVVDGSRVKAIQRELLQSLPILSIFRPF
jgi:polysaccharide biosynthesis/export protein